jgi:hypothetical protein
MLAALQAHNLYLNIDKCQFKQPYIDYLGVRIENNQVKMEEAKVDQVREWKPP